MCKSLSAFLFLYLGLRKIFHVHNFRYFLAVMSLKENKYKFNSNTTCHIVPIAQISKQPSHPHFTLLLLSDEHFTSVTRICERTPFLPVTV